MILMFAYREPPIFHEVGVGINIRMQIQKMLATPNRWLRAEIFGIAVHSQRMDFIFELSIRPFELGDYTCRGTATHADRFRGRYCPTLT